MTTTNTILMTNTAKTTMTTAMTMTRTRMIIIIKLEMIHKQYNNYKNCKYKATTRPKQEQQ